MAVDLAVLKRQSRISAILTAVGSLVVLTALASNYVMYRKEVSVADTLRSERDRSQQLSSQLQATQSALNAFIGKTPNAQTGIDLAIASQPQLAREAPRVFLEYPVDQQEKIAENAATALRQSGFTVPPVHAVGALSPPHTEVRFVYDVMFSI